jgi:hypothetical protein
MLRSELPFAVDSGPRRALAVVLGEPFLGFLALAALGITLFPARRGAGAAAVDAYTRFKSDIDYLYDTMLNIREEVLSVIDLHLNVVSFEMNRVMRVLAVIGALGLIPAIVGGLIAPPSMLALPQVIFLVFFGMAIGLYFFLIKGWLR